MSEQKDKEQITEKIEVVIKALGTMVIIPEYIKDDVLDISVKPRYTQGIQQPIISGKGREIVIEKLVELISNL